MEKSMGKGIVILAAITFLLFSSCQTMGVGGPVVWDDSIPADKLATVQFINMKVDSFNGIGVEKFNWVEIPAGEATLGADVTIYHAGVNFRANGMEFTCNFREGKTYKVSGGVNDMRWGVNVYEDGELRAFVPFKEPPVFTN